MTNKLLIEKLKEQVKSLREMEDQRYWSWFDRTEIYILGLSLDKKDDSLKNNVIEGVNYFLNNIPSYESYDTDESKLEKDQETLECVKRVLNILVSFINVLEIKEEVLLDVERKEIEKEIRKELEKEMKKEFVMKVKEMEKKMKKENKESNNK